MTSELRLDLHFSVEFLECLVNGLHSMSVEHLHWAGVRAENVLLLRLVQHSISSVRIASYHQCCSLDLEKLVVNAL